MAGEKQNVNHCWWWGCPVLRARKLQFLPVWQRCSAPVCFREYWLSLLNICKRLLAAVPVGTRRWTAAESQWDISLSMNCYGLPGKTALSTSNSSFGKQLAGITAAGATAVRWISCPVALLGALEAAEPRCCPCALRGSLCPGAVCSLLPGAMAQIQFLGSSQFCLCTDLCWFPVPFLPHVPCQAPRCLPGSPDPLLPPGFLRVVWLFAQGCLRLLSKLLLASPVA